MVPPVLMMATLGKSCFCFGSGGEVKVGLVPLPIFLICVVGVIFIPVL